MANTAYAHCPLIVLKILCNCFVSILAIGLFRGYAVKPRLTENYQHKSINWIPLVEEISSATFDTQRVTKTSCSGTHFAFCNANF
jgi:hypothetical protein